MKAAQLVQYGGVEAVKVQDAAKPTASGGKVVVQVHAAAVNPFDWKVREGAMKERAPLDLPATLGGDFAGVIAEVGDGVKNFKVGDAVYGHSGTFSGGGSLAEFVLADVGVIASKPKNLSNVEAAAVPLTAVSAWIALVEHLNIQKGQKILIHGGAGGIGSFAIQLAKHLGAYVITTVDADDVQYVKERGADEVIDYKKDQFEDKVSNLDAVFDTVGGETFTHSFRVLKRGGAIATMHAQPGQPHMDQYEVHAFYISTKVTRERLEKITPLLEQSVLKIHVDKIYPLEQAAEALEYLKSGHPKGKVVVQI